MVKRNSAFGAKQTIAACTFLAAFALAPVASAQDDEPDEVQAEPEADSSDDEGDSGGSTVTRREAGDNVDFGAAAEGAKPAGGEPALNETHAVQSGDTLWDLCGKYLNSPWYWPKIWSYNPQISNAHWIFPGNELRFYPSDESLPTNVEVSRQMAMEDEPQAISSDDLVQTSGVIEVGKVAAGSFVGQHIGFVSVKQHEIAGQIVNSAREAQLLSDFDRAYVKLKSAAKKGEPYAVYRTLKPIEHPITGEPYGYVVEIIGGVSVVDTSPTVATVMVRPTYQPVERGDFVGPWPTTLGKRVEPTPSTANVKGYIVETLEAALNHVGEHHMVFIDRGRTHGVQVGNEVTVYHRGDGYTEEYEGLPNEPVGRLMIIDVQEETATAIVVRSFRELSVGDKIEMSSSSG